MENNPAFFRFPPLFHTWCGSPVFLHEIVLLPKACRLRCGLTPNGAAPTNYIPSPYSDPCRFSLHTSSGHRPASIFGNQICSLPPTSPVFFSHLALPLPNSHYLPFSFGPFSISARPHSRVARGPGVWGGKGVTWTPIPHRFSRHPTSLVIDWPPTHRFR